MYRGVLLQVSEKPIPDHLVDEARAARQELVEAVADVDEEVGDTTAHDKLP